MSTDAPSVAVQQGPKGLLVPLERKHGSIVILEEKAREHLIRRMKNTQFGETVAIQADHNCVYILESPEEPKFRVRAMALGVHLDAEGILRLDGGQKPDGQFIQVGVTFMSLSAPMAATVEANIDGTGKDLPRAPSAAAERAQKVEKSLQALIIGGMLDKDPMALSLGRSILRKHAPGFRVDLPLDEQVRLFTVIRDPAASWGLLRDILITRPQYTEDDETRACVIEYCETLVAKGGPAAAWLTGVMKYIPPTPPDLPDRPSNDPYTSVVSGGKSVMTFRQILDGMDAKSPLRIGKLLDGANEKLRDAGAVDAAAKDPAERDALGRLHKLIHAASQPIKSVGKDQGPVNPKVRQALADRGASTGTEMAAALGNIHRRATEKAANEGQQTGQKNSK